MAQRFGEELVIAIPPPLVVQWNEEEIGLLHLFQHRLAAGLSALLAHDRLTECSLESFKDGGLEQKGLDRLGLAGWDPPPLGRKKLFPGPPGTGGERRGNF